MKKTLLALAAVATFGIANAAEITVDFSNPESLGVTKAAAGEATVSEGFTFEGVKVTITQGSGLDTNQELRFFTSSSDVVDFRCSANAGKKGHKFAVEYTENIKAIVFVGANTTASKNFNFTADNGSFTAPEWTGDSKTVTFTTTGEVHLKSMTIYTGTSQVPDLPTPTPVSKFEKATSLESGKYVFAVVEDGALKLASPAAASLTYGRMTLAAATMDGEYIATEKENAFDITVADGKVSIKDANGRFYAMDDSHFTSFQFYTEANEGCYWTYEFVGETVKLANALNTDCIISQTKGNQGTWYTNVAPAKAPAEYNLPVLYKLVGGAGIAEVEIDANAPVEYYNLLGVRVDEPTAGLYIRRQGKSVTKVLVK